MNTKTLYIMKHIALVTLFAMGFLLVPAFNSTGTVLAQKGLNKEVASTEALYQALNLGQASDLTVYADQGVSDKANSAINGKVLTQADALSGKGELARKDLSTAFSKINQLPCTQVSDSNLSGKTFGPGVYCLSSAELEGQLTLDGANSNSAIFVFRIAGSLNTKSGSNISLINGTQSGGVFFSAQDSATIGESTNFKGNILARNSILAESGAVIEGKALSLKGDVQLNNSILAPAAPGVIEICKAIDTTFGGGLENRIFQYQIGAQIISVAAGECSPQISVEASNGPVTITELNSGTFTNAPGTWTGNFQLIGVNQLDNVGAPAGTTTTLVSANLPQRTALVNVVAGNSAAQTRIQFVNRFAIIAAVEICKEAIDSGVSGIFNFTIDGLRNGDTTNLTPGPVVGGTVGASGTLPGTPAGLVTFPVFAGQCSGSIFVPTPADSAGSPRASTVTINELPRFGFIFTSVTTAPGQPGYPFANRLINFNALANGGGNATVYVVAGTTGPAGGNSTTGAVNTQTTVFFNNRTVPGTVKVCKVAGPGVAVNTPFAFEVYGVVANNPVAVPTTVPVDPNGPGTQATTVNVPNTNSGGLPVTQNPSQGTAATGATLQGGTIQRFDVNVLAGAEPTGIPFSGGNCVDVRTVPTTAGSTAPTVPFVVDTAVFIRELGPTSTTIVNADGSSTGVTGQVRVSRITSNTGILATGNAATTAATITTFLTTGNGAFAVPNPISGTGTVQPNVMFYPTQTGATTGGVTTAVYAPVRAGVTEVEFVNIAFFPVPLKVCKIAGTGLTANNPAVTPAVTFTVTPDNANGLLNASPTTVSVIPGASTTESPFGNCDFVGGFFGGPFGNGTATINSNNSFGFNTAVTVQETGGVSNTVVPTGGIFSPPGSPAVIANTVNRSGTISNLGTGTNEIVFINQTATAASPIKSRKRIRFF